MKKQTFIVFIYNADGKRIDFERFACKKVDTVKKHMNILFNDRLYRICTPGAASWKVFETPDGVNHGENPVYIHNLA